MSSFYSKEEYDKSTMLNSDVNLEVESMNFASAKDNNPVMASISYFGVIEEIWEVDYAKFRVPVFKCKWVDNNTEVHVDELGFTLVDLNKVAYKEDPFIMAYQARQVFYVKDPSNERWSVVLKGRMPSDTHDHSSLNLIDSPSILRRIPHLNEEVHNDEEHVTCNDHNEGIWENILKLP